MLREKAAERKQTRAALEKLKTRRQLTKEAQVAFNAFIRERDKNQPCISCGILNAPERHGGAWDCGHYRTVGAAPHLRFNEANAHRQCKACNGGSGRFSSKARTVGDFYRARLVDRIGPEAIEALERNNQVVRFDTDELRALRDMYRRRLRELRAGA